MNSISPPTPPPAPGKTNSPPPPPAPVKLGRIAMVAAILIIIGLIAGILPRWLARRALAKETAELSVQSVAVVSPAPGKSDRGVPLPAEVQAFVEAPIYARASGYLKRWLV